MLGLVTIIIHTPVHLCHYVDFPTITSITVKQAMQLVPALSLYSIN